MLLSGAVEDDKPAPAPAPAPVAPPAAVPKPSDEDIPEHFLCAISCVSAPWGVLLSDVEGIKDSWEM